MFLPREWNCLLDHDRAMRVAPNRSADFRFEFGCQNTAPLPWADCAKSTPCGNPIRRLTAKSRLDHISLTLTKIKFSDARSRTN